MTRDERVRVTWSQDVGFLYRSEFVYQLKRLAILCEVGLELAEDRGWFSSHYFFGASGSREDMALFRNSLKVWTNRLVRQGLIKE